MIVVWCHVLRNYDCDNLCRTRNGKMLYDVLWGKSSPSPPINNSITSGQLKPGKRLKCLRFSIIYFPHCYNLCSMIFCRRFLGGKKWNVFLKYITTDKQIGVFPQTYCRFMAVCLRFHSVHFFVDKVDRTSWPPNESLY